MGQYLLSVLLSVLLLEWHLDFYRIHLGFCESLGRSCFGMEFVQTGLRGALQQVQMPSHLYYIA